MVIGKILKGSDLHGGKFFCMTNAEETYGGFTYKTGVNVSDIPISKLFDIHSDDTSKLWFVDANNICDFLTIDAIYIREVTFDDDAIIVKYTEDTNNSIIYRAHCVTLGERASLNDVSVWKNLVDNQNVDDVDIEYLFKWASHNGYSDVVEYLKTLK